MDGLKNFLNFLNENWTTLLAICGLIAGIGKKTMDYLSKSTDEKIETAKEQIQEIVLKLITDAEITWETWNEAGSIKRSQVIAVIYEKYPILAKATDQTALVEWIDDTINTALKTLRKIVSSNKSEDEG